jgi:indolepyruvate ferredoxin oxidoreductase alpha subunit
MTLSYTANGGLVLVSVMTRTTVPERQDNRNYAKFRKSHVEPAIVRRRTLSTGFEVSEKFDTVAVGPHPDLHPRGSWVEGRIVSPGLEIRKQTEKFTMLPSNARVRHRVVEERLLNEEFAETFPGIGWRSRSGHWHHHRDLFICQETFLGILTLNWEWFGSF